MLMGYVTMIVSLVLWLLRCIHLKCKGRDNVVQSPDTVNLHTIISTEEPLLVSETAAPAPEETPSSIRWAERTHDNNRTLDQHRIFEEV
jgi:hypothetical protein